MIRKRERRFANKREDNLSLIAFLDILKVISSVGYLCRRLRVNLEMNCVNRSLAHIVGVRDGGNREIAWTLLY